MNSDENVVSASLTMPSPMMSSLIKPMKGDLEHSIKTWLARPYRFNVFTFSSSDALLSELAQVFCFSDIAARPYYANKLLGFAGFRATVTVKLQVNANRFQQGRLCLLFTPGSVDSTLHKMIGNSRTKMTQQPRVDIDINTQSEVELTIPYVSDVPFYVFGSPSSFMGHFAVRVYSRLLAATSELNCECTLWTSLKDVELFWPSDITPQMGSNRVKDITGREIIGDHKPISSFLGRVSSATNVLSKIPALSTITAPVSWMTAILGSAAHAMGWCKPQSSKKTPVALTQALNWANATGADYSNVLGMFEDNKLIPMSDIGGSSVDQMNLKYPLSIPTFWGGFTMATTDDQGTRLFSADLSPWHFYDQDLSGNLNYTRMYTPIGYLALFHQYWRGSFNIKLKAVKTEFHTGRLQVIISPLRDTTRGDNYSIRKVIDLREANEWTIHVPYMNQRPYTSTTTIGDYYTEGAYIDFVVMNELRAPDTVSSTINFLIEISAGDDFELAAPCVGNIWTYDTYAQIPSANLADLYPKHATVGAVSYVPQMAEYQEPAHITQGDVGIANFTPESKTLVPSSMCMGEIITSVKQLALRPSPVGATAESGAYRFYVDTGRYVKYNGGDVPTYFGIERPTYYDAVVNAYAFYRGGVRLKQIKRNTFAASSTNYQTKITVPSNTGYFVKSLDTINPGAIMDSVVQAGVNGHSVYNVLDYTIPHYCTRPVRRSPITSDISSQSVGGVYSSRDDNRALNVSPYCGTGWPALGSTREPLYISAADDFQCSFWVGGGFMGIGGQKFSQVKPGTSYDDAHSNFTPNLFGLNS